MTANRISWPHEFSSITTLFLMFISTPTFANPDSITRNQPTSIEARGKTTSAYARVEKIGNELFKLGTTQKIQLASLDLMHKQDIINVLLIMQAEQNFSLVERNVDNYLDWYYSLSGEYMRIYKMVTGEKLDDYMREKLIEHLQEKNPFLGFERALQEAESKNVLLIREHKTAVQRILDTNRVHLDASAVVVIQHRSMEKIINPSMHFDFEALRKRLLKSGTKGTIASSMSSAITSKVMERVDSQNILKLAAKTLAKFATSKATGSLGGASAGAAIGSAVPGVGTAIGAVIGVVIGGIVIDKGILTLDELMSREPFKDGIMGAIADVKIDLIETMKPEPALFFQ